MNHFTRARHSPLFHESIEAWIQDRQWERDRDHETADSRPLRRKRDEEKLDQQGGTPMTTRGQDAHDRVTQDARAFQEHSRSNWMDVPIPFDLVKDDCRCLEPFCHLDHEPIEYSTDT